MSEDSDFTQQMRAITISREYGSGGGEIAFRLAQRLGWRLLDHSIVARIANAMRIRIEEAEAYDECVEGRVSQLLNTMQYLPPSPDSMGIIPFETFPSEKEYRNVVNKLVRAAIVQGQVVIVGRASQVILAELQNVLHVRILAPFEKRVACVMQREGVDYHTAESRIHAKDRDRARHLQREYHQKLEDGHLYDLVVNTSLLDLESAVEIICFTLQQKVKRLSAKTHEPGLPQYPWL